MWKSIILLLWLSVPLCGYLFLRTDYANYQDDCRAQRKDCLARADMLARYSGYFERHARMIPNLMDKYDAREWQREWQNLQDAMEQEHKGLRQSKTAYYPRAAETLEEAEAAITGQQKAIQQAQRQQGFALDLRNSLAELEQLIYEAQAASLYYQRAGSDSIYMFLQEILAQREAAYLSRQREYDGFSDSMARELAKAKRLARDTQRILAQINDKLQVDEQRTYREELRTRFAKFNLGEQLSAMLSDIV